MQWISVEERLPPQRDYYQVVCTLDDTRWSTRAFWDRHRFHVKIHGSIVTYWMPRPGLPKESKPAIPELGAFYILVGDLACPADRIFHRETGREICQLLDADLGQRICARLNELWERDKGTTEEHHDHNTSTDCCDNRSTACGDHCRTDK